MKTQIILGNFALSVPDAQSVEYRISEVRLKVHYAILGDAEVATTAYVSMKNANIGMSFVTNDTGMSVHQHRRRR